MSVEAGSSYRKCVVLVNVTTSKVIIDFNPPRLELAKPSKCRFSDNRVPSVKKRSIIFMGFPTPLLSKKRATRFLPC